MKKIILLILGIIITTTFSGCKKNTLNGTSVIKKFDIEEASKTVDAYMKADIKNDVPGMDKLYSSSFVKKIENKVISNVIITGYKFDQIMQTGQLGQIKVKVTKLNPTAVYASLETYTFKVIKESNQYKIKDIETKNEKETFVSGSGIRLRSKDDAKTLLVTNFDGMPKYYYEQKDKAKTNMLPVDLSAFGVTALTYEGTSQALSTKGNNAYIEVVHYDESMMTQGGTGMQGGGTEGSGGSGGAGGSQGETNIAPEKPLAKEIVPIDIISGGIINNMVFSEDEKYLAVQYVKSSGDTSIRMYKNKTGEQIPFEFEKNYPMDKVNVLINIFDKNGLVYTVTPKATNSNDPAIKDIVGKWQIDTKKFKPSRVNG